MGCRRPAPDDRHRQDHQGLLARRGERASWRSVKQIVSYQSHPYGQKMNSDYFVALAETFEKRYGITFDGIRDGAVSDNKERLIQFKTNIDMVMSVLDKNGLGDWLADRLVAIGDTVKDDRKIAIDNKSRPFPGRAAAGRQPADGAAEDHGHEPASGAEKEVSITLFRKAGEVRARAAASPKSSSG